LLVASASVLAQGGLPADEGMISLLERPAFRTAEIHQPVQSDSVEPEEETVNEQFEDHIDLLQSQLEQLAYLQDQLNAEYLRLIRLREVSLAEIESLQARANQAREKHPDQEMPYRDEILLLEQQVAQCEQHLRTNEHQRRLQQQMGEELQGRIDQQQEEHNLWQEMQEAQAENSNL